MRAFLRGHGRRAFPSSAARPAPSRSFPLSLVLALSAGHLTVDFYNTFLLPVLPLVASHLGVSLGVAGVAASTFSMVSAWSQPAFGYLADRHGVGWTVAASVAWMAVLGSAVGLVHSLALLMAVGVLGSLGAAAYHPLGSVVVASRSEQKSSAMSVYVAGGHIGVAVAPLVVVPAVLAWGLEGMMYLAVPGLGVAFLLQALLSRSRPAPGVTMSPPLPAHAAAQAVAPAPAVARPARSAVSALVLITLIVTLRMWVSRSLITFGTAYGMGRGYPVGVAAAMLTLYLSCGTAGLLVGGYCADRWGHKLVVCAACLLGFPCLWGFLATSGWLSWTLLALGGFLFQSAFSVLVVMGGQFLPRHAGLAAGLVMGMCLGLGSLGAGATGLLADRIGLQPALEANVWLLVAAGLLALLLPAAPKERRPAGLPVEGAED